MHRAIVVLCALSAAAFFTSTVSRDGAAVANSSSPELQKSTDGCGTVNIADADLPSGVETATACNRPLESPADIDLTQRRTPAFVERQFRLPACLLRESRALASLRDCARLPITDTVALGDATAEEKAALVRARWVDGEWGDVIIGGTFIDLARALAEFEQDTELGQMLLRKMALEDAPKYANFF